MKALEPQILTAEVVYNGLGTPRADGAVVLQGERIAMIGSLHDARRSYPEAAVRDVGFAISPPPVNAHTHLDLSDLPYFSGSYEAFIGHVIQSQGLRGVNAARRGLLELERSGIFAFGDVVARAEVMRDLLTKPGLQGVAYWEVIGPHPEEADDVFAQTVEYLRDFRQFERPDGLKLGLSPHTPHTVSAPLLQKLARLAVAERLPLQIHVAESPEETAFHRTGEVWPRLRTMMPSWQPSGLSPVRYLAELGVLEARPTLVHMVNVTEDDVKRVAKAGCAVVHCPRSNEALGCGRFPWELYAKHGAEVAFGTDSLGSSLDLDVTREVQAARTLHGDKASPLALVRAAVKGGSRALGLAPPRFVRGDAATALYLWGEGQKGVGEA